MPANYKQELWRVQTMTLVKKNRILLIGLASESSEQKLCREQTIACVRLTITRKNRILFEQGDAPSLRLMLCIERSLQ